LIVLEQDHVFALDRFPDDGPLEGQRVHGIEVVAHDPRFVDVRRCRDHVGGEDGRLVARLQVDDLVAPRVTAGPSHAYARRNLAIAVEQVEHARTLQRQEVVLQVAGAVPLVRMRRVLPLLAAHDVTRVREGRTDASEVVPQRRAAEVIEVQVRREHHIDVVNAQARLGECVRHVAAAVDRVDVDALCVHLVANPRVDEQTRRAGSDEQRPRGQVNAVAIVCRGASLPERLRHHAKHRAAVETEIGVKERRQFEVAERD
jgi:hypothetical protein